MQVPKYMSKSARKWLKSLSTGFEFSEEEKQTILLAAICLDRIEQAREDIATRGLLIKNSFGDMKSNPSLKIELDNKAMFARLGREVGLFGNFENRIPRKIGDYRASKQAKEAQAAA